MLTLVCGIPNSGKTTFSERWSRNPVHIDELDGRNRLKTALDMVSQAEGDICVEGVYLHHRQRRELASAYEGAKLCIWLDTPLETCIEREDRGRGTLITRNCAALFEPPTLDEGWDEIVRIASYERRDSQG